MDRVAVRLTLFFFNAIFLVSVANAQPNCHSQETLDFAACSVMVTVIHGDRWNMAKALSLMLTVPFGVMYRGVRAAVQAKQLDGLKTTFEAALGEIGRIFAAFGAWWLTPEIPTTQERRADLL